MIDLFVVFSFPQPLSFLKLAIISKAGITVIRAGQAWVREEHGGMRWRVFRSV